MQGSRPAPRGLRQLNTNSQMRKDCDDHQPAERADKQPPLSMLFGSIRTAIRCAGSSQRSSKRDSRRRCQRLSSRRPCIAQASWIELRAQGVDVERLQSAGDLILLDADAVLTQSMVDGMPDGARFHDLMIANIERACRGREDCVVRAYGEMVDVLWKRGLTAAATRLELLWNQLAQTHQFSLLCGYSMGNFYKDAAQEDICRHHTHVLRDPGDPAAVHPLR